MLFRVVESRSTEYGILSRSISGSDLCVHPARLHGRRHDVEVGENAEKLMHTFTLRSSRIFTDLHGFSQEELELNGNASGST